MELVIKRYEELTADEMYEILRARINIFVVEQNCPYPEADGKDKKSCHIFYRNEDGVQAYIRVVDKGVSYPDEVSIGRVITVARGTGLGYKIMCEGIKYVREVLHEDRIRISAQLYAKGFYEKCGFRQVSEQYLEDDIPHIQMLYES